MGLEGSDIVDGRFSRRRFVLIRKSLSDAGFEKQGVGDIPQRPFDITSRGVASRFETINLISWL